MESNGHDSSAANQVIAQALDDGAKAYLRQWFERRAPNSMLRLWWEDFYRVHSAVLKGMAARIGLNPQESEDAVSDVCL